MSAKAEEHEKYPLTVSNWVGDSVMPDPHVVEMHNRDAKASTVQADELLELKKAMVELEAKVMAQRECYPLLSLHQAAILFLYDPGTRFNRKLAFQLLAFVVVFVQLWVLTGINNAASAAACARHRDCPGQRMCVPNWDMYGGRGNGCFNCGDGPVRRALRPYLPAEVADDSCCLGIRANVFETELQSCCGFAHLPVLRPAAAEEFECPEDDDVCNSCLNSVTKTFSNYTFNDEVRDNVTAMQYKDWIAVCLATVVLALQIADEVRDITLCELSGYELNSMQDTNNTRRAKFLFQVLICVIRRYCILPCLCASAFVLITYRGGDAMSVSLNTVALVFILQCDDLLYEKCVDLRVRADADKVQSTIKEMDQPTLGLIAWTKVAHVVAVPSTTLAALLVEKYHTEGTPGIGVYDGAFVVGMGILIVGLGESQVQKRVDMSGGRVQSFLWAGFKGFLGALVATSVTTTH